MQCSPNDDDVSVHSDDSVVSSLSLQKEKLDSLINLELKHSGVYRDIHFKDNLLKVDLDNLYNTCQRLEIQIKKKSEQLDDLYEKLSDDQKNIKAQLEKKLSHIFQQFAETNTHFCDAFDVYSYDVSKDTYEFLNIEKHKVQQKYLKISDDLSVFQQRENFNDIVIKLQPTKISEVNNAVNMLSEISTKRPEIKLEEANAKLLQEIQQLTKRF